MIFRCFGRPAVTLLLLLAIIELRGRVRRAWNARAAGMGRNYSWLRGASSLPSGNAEPQSFVRSPRELLKNGLQYSNLPVNVTCNCTVQTCHGISRISRVASAPGNRLIPGAREYAGAFLCASETLIWHIQPVAYRMPRSVKSAAPGWRCTESRRQRRGQSSSASRGGVLPALPIA